MSKTIFSDGDPSHGTQGTLVTAAFLNALQNHVHDGADADGHAPKVATGNVDFFATGRRLWIHEANAPAGWTIDEACADCLLAVGGGIYAYNGAGGSRAGAWAQDPHYHVKPEQFVLAGYVATPPEGNPGGWLPAGVEGMPSLNHTHWIDIGAMNTFEAATVATWRPLANVGIIIVKG